MSTSNLLVPRPLTDAQVILGLQHLCASSTLPLRDEVILWLAIFAGLRAHEIAGLNLSALFDESGTVSQCITIDRHLVKYGPARAVPMLQRVQEALLRFRASFPDVERLSETLDDRPIALLRNWLTSAYAAIGYTEAAAHRFPVRFQAMTDLRHSNARIVSRNDRPTASSRRLGNPNQPAKPKRVSFRYADIVRAVSAAQRAGLDVLGTEIGSDGTVRLLHKPAMASAASAYDQWKERRGADRP